MFSLARRKVDGFLLHGKDERDDEVYRVARVNDKILIVRMISSVVHVVRQDI